MIISKKGLNFDLNNYLSTESSLLRSFDFDNVSIFLNILGNRVFM